MATTVQPPGIEPLERPLIDGNSGGGNGRNLGPAGPTAVDERPAQPARTGIWVGLAAIAMSFAAFTSALVVRQSTANDWRHLRIPSIVFLNTGVLLASSGALEVARRKVASYFRHQNSSRAAPLLWLSATLLLGLAFVVGQYAAWLELRSQGLYLATNPNSSFFYVLTAMHALHVLGGLAGLARVLRRMSAPVVGLRRSTMDATSYYWHFMGVLWLYLLWVVWMKL